VRGWEGRVMAVGEDEVWIEREGERLQLRLRGIRYS
jgi:hypothetical protein